MKCNSSLLITAYKIWRKPPSRPAAEPRINRRRDAPPRPLLPVPHGPLNARQEPLKCSWGRSTQQQTPTPAAPTGLGGRASLRRTCGLRTRVIPHGNPPGWDEAAGEAGAGWTATHMHRSDRPHGAGPRGGPAHAGNVSSRKPEAKPPRPSLDPKDRWRVYQDLPGRMPTPPQPSALGWRPHPSPPWFPRLPTCPPSRALWAGPAEAERGSLRWR